MGKTKKKPQQLHWTWERHGGLAAAQPQPKPHSVLAPKGTRNNLLGLGVSMRSAPSPPTAGCRALGGVFLTQLEREQAVNLHCWRGVLGTSRPRTEELQGEDEILEDFG